VVSGAAPASVAVVRPAVDAPVFTPERPPVLPGPEIAEDDPVDPPTFEGAGVAKLALSADAGVAAVPEPE